MNVEKPLVEAQDDFGLLCLVVANGFTEAVLDALTGEGFGDAKFSHGFIVQGLLAGDRTVTELAGRLGVTVQAVSKTVQEMERLGYIKRGRDPEDGRSWVLTLSARGRENLATARRARLHIQERLIARLGAARSAEALELLRELADEFGGMEALAARRLRPPAS